MFFEIPGKCRYVYTNALYLYWITVFIFQITRSPLIFRENRFNIPCQLSVSFGKSTNFVFLVPKILKNCYCELKENQKKITSVQGNTGRFKQPSRPLSTNMKYCRILVPIHYFTDYVYTPDLIASF
jgi:hypothetical protein